MRDADLDSLSAEQLWRARNEIFARRGLIFQSVRGKKLSAALGARYVPVTENQDAICRSMNVVEQTNVEAIQRREKKAGR